MESLLKAYLGELQEFRNWTLGNLKRIMCSGLIIIMELLVGFLFDLADPVIYVHVCDVIVSDVTIRHQQLHSVWLSCSTLQWVSALKRTAGVLEWWTDYYFTCWTCIPGIVLVVMVHHPPLHLLLKGVCAHLHPHKGGFRPYKNLWKT